MTSISLEELIIQARAWQSMARGLDLAVKGRGWESAAATDEQSSNILIIWPAIAKGLEEN